MTLLLPPGTTKIGTLSSSVPPLVDKSSSSRVGPPELVFPALPFSRQEMVRFLFSIPGLYAPFLYSASSLPSAVCLVKYACVYICICISIYVNIRICMYMSMYVCMGMSTSTLPAALYAMGAFKPLVLSAHVCHLLSPSPCLTSSV